MFSLTIMFDGVLRRSKESKEEHFAVHISSPGHSDTSWKRSQRRRDGPKPNKRKKKQWKYEAEENKSLTWVNLTAEVGAKCQTPVSRLLQVAVGALKWGWKSQFQMFSNPWSVPRTSYLPPVIQQALRNCSRWQGEGASEAVFLWPRRLISLHVRIFLFQSSRDDCSNVLNRMCACLMGNM